MMNKLLFEQPKLTVEVFSAKEDILTGSGIGIELDDDEMNLFQIAPITSL